MTSMEDIVSLCKRRGFIFPGSDIYGGMAGLYDFGPYGVELLNNLKQNWWKHNIQMRPDYVGLDSAMFKNQRFGKLVATSIVFLIRWPNAKNVILGFVSTKSSKNLEFLLMKK